MQPTDLGKTTERETESGSQSRERGCWARGLCHLAGEGERKATALRGKERAQHRAPGGGSSTQIASRTDAAGGVELSSLLSYKTPIVRL